MLNSSYKHIYFRNSENVVIEKAQEQTFCTRIYACVFGIRGDIFGHIVIFLIGLAFWKGNIYLSWAIEA